MKISLDNGVREINITCKGLYNKKRANKDDLSAILNELSIVYSEAAKYNQSIGGYATAKSYEAKSKELYEICKELGAYD